MPHSNESANVYVAFSFWYMKREEFTPPILKDATFVDEGVDITENEVMRVVEKLPFFFFYFLVFAFIT